MLTAGRHGGLQNMEVRGIVMLRITDPNMSKIAINYDNNDNKGFQMQVGWLEDLVYETFKSQRLAFRSPSFERFRTIVIFMPFEKCFLGVIF